MSRPFPGGVFAAAAALSALTGCGGSASSRAEFCEQVDAVLADIDMTDRPFTDLRTFLDDTRARRVELEAAFDRLALAAPDAVAPAAVGVADLYRRFFTELDAADWSASAYSQGGFAVLDTGPLTELEAFCPAASPSIPADDLEAVFASADGLAARANELATSSEVRPDTAAATLDDILAAADQQGLVVSDQTPFGVGLQLGRARAWVCLDGVAVVVSPRPCA